MTRHVARRTSRKESSFRIGIEKSFVAVESLTVGGFDKARYRGMAKNHYRLVRLFRSGQLVPAPQMRDRTRAELRLKSAQTAG